MKETKTASGTPEARAAMHEMMSAFEAIKWANDARLYEIERKAIQLFAGGDTEGCRMISLHYGSIACARGEPNTNPSGHPAPGDHVPDRSTARDGTAPSR